MLKEKNIYKDELPIKVTTVNVESHPIHYHEDMEVIFLLEGELKLRDGYYNYTLKEGDVFVVNDREMHSLESNGEDNMVMILHLSMAYFSRYYDDLKNDFFVVNNEDNGNENLEVLRNIMARIMIEILQKGYGYEQKVIESTHNLIACLMSDFKCGRLEEGDEESSKSKGNRVLSSRLNRITDYMHENYSRKLTLNEIADKEGLSIFYLSHIIKEATDLSFQDLLSYIRVEESEKILMGTNKKLGAIAEEVGFSAVRYYTKHFTTWFGMHPNEYRKKNMGKTSLRETSGIYKMSSPSQIESAIRNLVKGAYSEYVETLKQPPIIVDVNINEEKECSGQGLSVLDSIPSSDVKEVLYEPYRLLKSMDERVIASGRNYMVTTSANPEGPIDNLSILVYSFDEDAQRHLANFEDKEDQIKMISAYEGQSEFLIRCSGLFGTYRVLRHRLSKAIIAIKMSKDEAASDSMTKREKIAHSIMTKPEISGSTVTSTDIMSIRSVFKGVGAELILIDKVRGKD